MSVVMNLAPADEITPLINNLMVFNSAVLVDTST